MPPKKAATKAADEDVPVRRSTRNATKIDDAPVEQKTTKRGRKKQSEEKQDDVVMDAKNDAPGAAPVADAVVPDVVQPAEPEAKPKRGRGKKSEVKEPVADYTNPPVDAAAVVTDVESKPKRGRGKKREADNAATTDDKKAAVGDDEPEVKTTTKLVKKGKACVEPRTGLQDKGHILCEGDLVYSVMLNQTDIGNNNNKYYQIQCIEADSGNGWWTYNRWGRVGLAGQEKLTPYSNKAQAVADFVSKYQDKTKNKWGAPTFNKVDGKYAPVEIDYGDEEEVKEETKPKSEAPKEIPCTLDKRVQDLVSLICNVKNMQQTLIEMEFDIRKMPLGKLTKANIHKGYDILKELEAELTSKSRHNTLIELSNKFYTTIPHDFGMRRPPVIDNLQVLKKKIELMETLGDIEVATKVMAENDNTINQLDSNYANLKCNIKPLDKNSEAYKLIEKYVSNTHGHTHSYYKLAVEDAYEIERQGETPAAAAIHNHQLLWHGSRLTNYVGILSQGLRIAPPEAPSTGYMFGKGVYFANMVTKSANYCFANNMMPDGLLLLCDVALGNPYEKTQSEFVTKLPEGKHSTWGRGRTVPDPNGCITFNGLTVPMGVEAKSGLSDTSLEYDEFIVYDVKQIQMKYLVKTKFQFKY